MRVMTKDNVFVSIVDRRRQLQTLSSVVHVLVGSLKNEEVSKLPCLHKIFVCEVDVALVQYAQTLLKLPAVFVKYLALSKYLMIFERDPEF
jgi:hypothetical protein